MSIPDFALDPTAPGILVATLCAGVVGSGCRRNGERNSLIVASAWASAAGAFVLFVLSLQIGFLVGTTLYRHDTYWDAAQYATLVTTSSGIVFAAAGMRSAWMLAEGEPKGFALGIRAALLTVTVLGPAGPFQSFAGIAAALAATNCCVLVTMRWATYCLQWSPRSSWHLEEVQHKLNRPHPVQNQIGHGEPSHAHRIR